MNGHQTKARRRSRRPRVERSSTNPWVTLAVCVAIGFVVYGALLWVVWS